MHTRDELPAKEDETPDKATEDGHKVSSSDPSSEFLLPMHAGNTHKKGLPGALKPERRVTQARRRVQAQSLLATCKDADGRSYPLHPLCPTLAR